MVFGKTNNLLIVITSIFGAIYLTLSAENVCLQASDCSQCMLKSPNCVWCLDTNFTSGENVRRSRCNTAKEFNGTCENTTDISSSNQIIKNDPFDAVVQVQPQEAIVRLRPGQPTKFNVSIKPAPDFPVDIYFLTDASNSMRDDLQNIRLLSTSIAGAIQGITKNFRLGFGTFVDKNNPPFTEGPKSPDFPCNYVTSSCEIPFTFKHSSDFSNDSTTFQEVVGAQNISGDFDDPEGGFEALMQLAVCEQVIGWKEKGKARRIVLFVADALPKIAGDGRLIGRLRQNDGQCYMTRNPGNALPIRYNVNDMMDYPSLSQLRDAMKANDIFPLFAVTNDRLEVYQEIARAWSSLGAAVDEINEDSSNIVQLLRENYQKISSTVSITEPSNNFLRFDFRVVPSSCRETYDPAEPGRCTEVKIGQQIDIEVSITAQQCPSDFKEESVVLTVLGFGEVKLNTSYLCDCTCSSNPELNSPYCNGVGARECGICKCNSGFYGSRCQCDSNSQSQVEDTLACTNPEDSTVCSNEGLCVCGKCECFRKQGNREVTGPFCQCKNFGCPTGSSGEECSGETRGFCKCGRCECKPEYDGVNCGSPNCEYLRNTVCFRNGIECSNNGQCDDCGKCQCNVGFGGDHCETCETDQCKCEQFGECVLCKVFDKKDLNCSSCDSIDMFLVNTTTDQCRAQFNESCFALFQYTPNATVTKSTQNQTLIVYNRLVCTKELVDDDDNTAIAVGTIAGIVLLGLLLLLLFKLLLMLSDRREYKRFEKSNKKSQWQEDHNPIYHPPEQQFENPAFSGEQQ